MDKNNEIKTRFSVGNFTFSIKINAQEQIKERTILSCIAKILNPLGLVSAAIAA